MSKPGTISYKTLNINGNTFRAASPVIISASRATDIPAFQGRWLKQQIDQGYVKRKNPFSGKSYFIDLQSATAYVFWTKNPKPFFSFLKSFMYDYYFQFTLNNYDKTGLEPKIPELDQRIETFKLLANKIGNSRVLWRYDPILILPDEDVFDTIERIDYVASKLKGYTTRLTFSFLTLNPYASARKRLLQNFSAQLSSVYSLIPNEEERKIILDYLSNLQQKWQSDQSNFRVQACAMNEDYSGYGINAARCIDDQLLAKLFPNNKKLMCFLGKPDIFGYRKQLPSDKSQRKACRCIPSKDIGTYNTCKHECLYCYANKK